MPFLKTRKRAIPIHTKPAAINKTGNKEKPFLPSWASAASFSSDLSSIPKTKVSGVSVSEVSIGVGVDLGVGLFIGVEVGVEVGLEVGVAVDAVVGEGVGEGVGVGVDGNWFARPSVGSNFSE